MLIFIILYMQRFQHESLLINNIFIPCCVTLVTVIFFISFYSGGKTGIQDRVRVSWHVGIM